MARMRRVSEASPEFLDRFYPNVIEPRVRELYNSQGIEDEEEIAERIIENSPENTQNGLRKLLYEYGLLSQIAETVSELRGEAPPKEEIPFEVEAETLREREETLTTQLELEEDEETKRELRKELREVRDRKREVERKPPARVEEIPTVEVPKEAPPEPAPDTAELSRSLRRRIVELETQIREIGARPTPPAVGVPPEEVGVTPEETARRVEQVVAEAEKPPVVTIGQRARQVGSAAGNVARRLLRFITGR